MEVGIISEGYTDQILIEAVVQGILGDNDQTIDPLQPKLNEQGGWSYVFDYCKSNDFTEALPYKELLIIHIDCDVLKGHNIPLEYTLNFNGLSIEESYNLVKNKFIEFIGEELYDQHSSKIVFAIAINEIECWLLPIYYPNKLATANKATNCIDTLNQVLEQQEGFYIDKKDPDNYSKIAKKLRKIKTIKDCQDKNESFALFYNDLMRALSTDNVE